MAAFGAIVDRIQQELEAIYRIDSPLRAADFVIDRKRWEAMSQSGAPEELVVVETDGELEIGLFLSEDVLEVLSAADARWTASRLAAHCQAVEGVSHFLYLTQRANVPRPVSQLELELQAEIDKYATVVLALWEAGRREAVHALLVRLFERVRYRENLSIDERARYEKANGLARLYCRFLSAKYVVGGRIEALLADLRHVYRLGAGDKLSYVARGAAL